MQIQAQGKSLSQRGASKSPEKMWSLAKRQVSEMTHATNLQPHTRAQPERKQNFAEIVSLPQASQMLTWSLAI